MNNRLHNISRINQPYTPGWQVRVWHAGSEYSQFVSDNRHGGKEEAKRKAIIIRDGMMKWRNELPPYKRDPVKPYYPEARNQTTGVIGVYLTWKLMRSGNRYPYYTTTSQVEGRSVTRAFSVNKYSMPMAFLLACAERESCLQTEYPDKFNQAEFDRSVRDHLAEMGGDTEALLDRTEKRYD